MAKPSQKLVIQIEDDSPARLKPKTANESPLKINSPSAHSEDVNKEIKMNGKIENLRYAL